jgi:diguanylate cyclase (GGDEF)-like protein
MKELLNNSRKTIGVLINEIDGWYGSLIIKGIKKIALERNINVLIFPGRSINSKWRDEVQHNVIYSIVNSEKLDGIIITSASLFNYVGLKESNDFLANFKDTPIVSISVQVTNTHSVVFDNKSSMYSVVNHLIKHHKYTRIAFITGPSSSTEAMDRFEGYKDALKDNNIVIDKNLIVEGEFTDESGMKAVELLFKQIKMNPHAVVSSNDQMAIGASFMLKKMGFKIGKDIALTGFDNSDEVKFFSPPLTTVTQPTFKMGCLAAELICDLLDGKQVNKCTNIKGELIVRQSCGCLNIPNKKSMVNNTMLLSNNIDFNTAFQIFCNNLDINKEEFVILALKHLNIPSSEQIETKAAFYNILEDFKEDVKEKNIKGSFIGNLNYILNENKVIKNQSLNWNKSILSLRGFIIRYATSYEILSLVEDIFYSACILANNILARFESYDSYNLRKVFIETRYTSEDFNSTVSLEALIKILKKYLLKIHIKKCYLCLYDNPTKYHPDDVFPLPDRIKLHLCYDEENEPSTEYFDTTEILPDKYMYLEERSELLFMPLFVSNLHFGFIVFSINELHENIFESLCEQISHSLNRQLLLNERKKAEEQLQIAVNQLEKYNHELRTLSIIDELTGLYNRRGFYIQSDKYYNWASSNNESLILFYGDLDGLKKINDNFGHKSGDEALKAAAKLLQKSFRNSDILSRLGGDEFTALATNISSSDTLKIILDRIDYSFNEFNKSNSLPFDISISIGYSIYNNSSKLPFDELLQEADSRLYEEKKRKKQKKLATLDRFK